jgi:hypothetical protein
MTASSIINGIYLIVFNGEIAGCVIWTLFPMYNKLFALPSMIAGCSWKLVRRPKISGKLLLSFIWTEAICSFYTLFCKREVDVAYSFLFLLFVNEAMNWEKSVDFMLIVTLMEPICST